MTFFETLEGLKSGKKYMRSCWINGVFIKTIGPNKTIVFCYKTINKDLNFEVIDFISNDWIEVQ